MKIYPLILLLCCFLHAGAQSPGVRGKIVNEKGEAIKGAAIDVLKRDSLAASGVSGDDGTFSLSVALKGRLVLSVSYLGYRSHLLPFYLTDSGYNAGTIKLAPLENMLDEVKIVTRALAVTQRDDTFEYRAGSFKVNADADAADLVRKLPAVALDGKTISAQGETVVKVLVDGKPFFGDDPYATLKNLPADIIDKVQVYNEKGEQEQLTGFSEGPVKKTINIITQPAKRKGVFGNVYGGGGANNGGETVYGTGATINRFNENRRITFTGQANNINSQNFTDDAPQAATGGQGITDTRAAGINYTDKWGEHTDFSGSYYFNSSASDVTNDTRKTYLLPSAAGQVYDEHSPVHNNNNNHRLNMRLSFSPDTSNMILLVPQLNYTDGSSVSTRSGITSIDSEKINSTFNSSNNNRRNLSAGGSAIFTHKGRRKGRTLSARLMATNNGTDNETFQKALNVFYNGATPNDSFNQQVTQLQHNTTIAGSASWTEPVSARSVLKLQYDVNAQPSTSEKNTYADTGAGYTTLDSGLSGSFTSANSSQKAGTSYLVRGKQFEVSAGLNYQLAVLDNKETFPGNGQFHKTFSNVLPLASFRYHFSKTSNLQCNYTTNTHAPSISQLQDVVNNADPLHMSTGNPLLKQPYTHNLSLRFYARGAGQGNVSLYGSASVTQHYITQATIIARSDTSVGAIQLYPGSQLSIPVNIEGYAMASGNANWSTPVKWLKSRLNITTSAAWTRTPAMVNGAINYQQNKRASLGLSLSSNISEKIDFSFNSNTSTLQNNNPASTQPRSSYINEACRASVNLVLPLKIVLNSAVNYQANFGLARGYNRNYAVWNVAVGKKLFKKDRGYLKFSVFDLLNKNNNVNRTVTPTYIADSQTNMLHRYYMLSFSWKIAAFGN